MKGADANPEERRDIIGTFPMFTYGSKPLVENKAAIAEARLKDAAAKTAEKKAEAFV
jgi:hypothetical protein